MSSVPPDRRVFHLDMDAFFASVHQRDDPSLRGRPVVVGGDPRGRGVVAAASYEARAFGVRSAMPCGEAARRCPDAVFVPPDMARYQEVSRALMTLLRGLTPWVEPLSLDEAYLDVSVLAPTFDDASALASSLRDRVRGALGLTASVGVAPNKLVAKIASDQRKPDGLTVVRPAEVRSFLAPLPVERLFGVGPATAARLHAEGFSTIGDLAALAEADLVAVFGRQGAWLARQARGEDTRPVQPARRRRSLGAERTFSEDVRDAVALAARVEALADRVAASLRARSLRGRSVTVKVRYADFETVTRSHTLAAATDAPDVVRVTARGLLARTEAGVRPVRLVGVSVGDVEDARGAEQLSLPLGSVGRLPVQHDLAGGPGELAGLEDEVVEEHDDVGP